MFFTAHDLPGLEIDTAITCLSVTSSSSLEVVYSSIDEDYRLIISDVREFNCESNPIQSGFDLYLSLQSNLHLHITLELQNLILISNKPPRKIHTPRLHLDYIYNQTLILKFLILLNLMRNF